MPDFSGLACQGDSMVFEKPVNFASMFSPGNLLSFKIFGANGNLVWYVIFGK